jgi:Carbohydrate binding domain
MKTHLIAWLPVASLALALSAQAQVVLVNGDFETGDFTGWDSVGSGGGGVSTGNHLVDGVYAGSYSAWFGPIGPAGGIGQSFTTIPGHSYTVSFELSNGSGGPVSFQANWNGTAQISSSTEGAFNWSALQYTATATSTTSTIQFVFIQVPSYYGLDNVSVVDISAVPEPSAYAVVSGLALLGFAAWSRRQR